MIKLDSKETLNCLANLYLDEEIMKNKNISNILKKRILIFAHDLFVVQKQDQKDQGRRQKRHRNDLHKKRN